MFLAGGAGAAYSTWAIYHRRRPLDVLFAVLAPVALLLSITGLLLSFVPGFLG
jgi:hypothetical protein